MKKFFKENCFRGILLATLNHNYKHLIIIIC